MSAPVDVLAVMDLAADMIHSEYQTRSNMDPSSELTEARAAVAELLEALAAFDGMSEPSMPGTPPNLRRLRNAYARCTGEGA